MWKSPPDSIGLLLKMISFLGVLGIFALAIGIEFYAWKETYSTLLKIGIEYSEEDDVVKKVLHSLDLILLGVITFAIGVVLFELFVHKINNLPKWLTIGNLDDLKMMMIQMVIVVMSISLTGRIVTWNGETDLLGYGVASGVVLFALEYLVVKKGKEKIDEESLKENKWDYSFLQL
ncbi:YqhA family protein [Maribacter sp.]|nr:YqhA family protein [Maribacter sp.]